MEHESHATKSTSAGATSTRASRHSDPSKQRFVGSTASGDKLQKRRSATERKRIIDYFDLAGSRLNDDEDYRDESEVSISPFQQRQQQQKPQRGKGRSPSRPSLMRLLKGGEEDEEAEEEDHDEAKGGAGNSFPLQRFFKRSGKRKARSGHSSPSPPPPLTSSPPAASLARMRGKRGGRFHRLEEDLSEIEAEEEERERGREQRSPSSSSTEFNVNDEVDKKEEDSSSEDTEEEHQPQEQSWWRWQWQLHWRYEITYFRVHLFCFAALSLFAGWLLWLLERGNPLHNNNDQPLGFTEAIFTATSAVCVVGLNVVDFARFRPISQLVIYLCMLLGAPVMESLWPVLVRKWNMVRRVRQALHEQEEIRKAKLAKETARDLEEEGGRQVEEREERERKEEGEEEGTMYLSRRTSSVLCREKNSVSGWVEYRALDKVLLWVGLYLFVLHVSSFLVLAIYLQLSSEAQHILHKNEENSWFWAFFHSLAALSNAGFALMPHSLEQMNHLSLVLLVLSGLTLLGNTAYPCVLRLMLWLRYRYHRSRRNPERYLYRYLLQHPRRCMTHLFPQKETMVLFFIILAFTFVEWGSFVFLDWNAAALAHLSPSLRLVNGFAQSVFTRTSGFNSVDIALLSPGMQVLYLGLMYISVYPFALSLRSTAEFSGNPRKEDEHAHERKNVLYQAKRMLIWDSSWLFIPWLLITIFETEKIVSPATIASSSTPAPFTIFRILFEVVSAYGCVGLSLGFPGVIHSFCGVWSPSSKWMLIFVMLMGRHRGLPDDIDKAAKIVLPASSTSASSSGDSSSLERELMEDEEAMMMEEGRRGGQRPSRPSLSALRSFVLSGGRRKQQKRKERQQRAKGKRRAYHHVRSSSLPSRREWMAALEQEEHLLDSLGSSSPERRPSPRTLSSALPSSARFSFDQ
ncbi:low affinity potassium transporter [Balamuthia mandrillaris]